ncbi:Nodule Cysteine-Rich (NCR) secreted peptide [Medicago truncatula]|uniref:Nodule Cysteine-Rich (NCR) secreted peptide n=1 Tax=Medicago truncatula TaxID=3880 RepID=A0A072TYZ0_MEDTR|nr:Nodule Cysteine-Rich (NCR) secreted peptide [Medicago truncatula]
MNNIVKFSYVMIIFLSLFFVVADAYGEKCGSSPDCEIYKCIPPAKPKCVLFGCMCIT